MFGTRGWALLVLLLAVPVTTAAANVVTDWDEKAVGIVQTGTLPLPPAFVRWRSFT